MFYLSEEKVNWILNNLRTQGLNDERLEGELLDHICCAVEHKMQENKLLFEQAYTQTIAAFGKEGILKVQKDTLKARKTRSISRRITHLSATIAACLILFIGVVVQAQERPNAHPLLKSIPVCSGFGKRPHPMSSKLRFHSGVDIRVPVGTKVFAPAGGKVVEAQFHQGRGYYVVIQHNDVYTTTYWHLSKILVRKNQYIKKGDNIALTGSTGFSTGPHLHYEVKKHGKVVNPQQYFGK
ncbi:M23 family metallopeptidase [uncultured Microscilla sp.]|uniref:M23 family metallopeptidase n=1 Tax=uncultured Microscilla sp. TaxID=432653 RepID=UPI002622E75B|nr:M23 family metallopeptidase [uncultured Microscilla sp.]